MVPSNILAITVMDYILLPCCVLMGISLVIYVFKRSNIQDPIEKRAVISALIAVSACLIFFIISILRFGWSHVTVSACDALGRLFVVVYMIHKLGVYGFVYFRMSLFSSLLSPHLWKCLTIFAVVSAIVYSANMILFVFAYNQISWSTADGYCSGTFVGRINFPAIAGAMQIFMDVAICFTGTVVFGRLFWSGALDAVVCLSVW